jgi:hypothetical protein
MKVFQVSFTSILFFISFFTGKEQGTTSDGETVSKSEKSMIAVDGNNSALSSINLLHFFADEGKIQCFKFKIFNATQSSKPVPHFCIVHTNDVSPTNILK